MREHLQTPDRILIVDDTPSALKALRPHVMGRLVVVFGAGGDRDRTKRPLMGRAAAEHADLAIVTDDNPRSEASSHIIDHILQGFQQPQRVQIIPGRAQAIRETISAASAGDVILLAGKGHETYQEINGVRHPFNDLEQARQALDAWEASHV